MNAVCHIGVRQLGISKDRGSIASSVIPVHRSPAHDLAAGAPLLLPDGQDADKGELVVNHWAFARANMRYINRVLCPVVIFLGGAFQAYPQGHLVPGGVTAYGNPLFVQVLQKPDGSDYTGFDLVPEGQNQFKFDVLLDEGVRTFVVSANDPISLQPIVEERYPELNKLGSYVFASGDTFYLGFYTGYNPWIVTNGTSIYTGIYSDPVFGWGEFVNENGTVKMLGSALEAGGGGIYAGTESIIGIPEPAPWALLLECLCLLTLGWAIRALARCRGVAALIAATSRMKRKDQRRLAISDSNPLVNT